MSPWQHRRRPTVAHPAAGTTTKLSRKACVTVPSAFGDSGAVRVMPKQSSLKRKRNDDDEGPSTHGRLPRLPQQQQQQRLRRQVLVYNSGLNHLVYKKLLLLCLRILLPMRCAWSKSWDVSPCGCPCLAMRNNVLHDSTFSPSHHMREDQLARLGALPPSLRVNTTRSCCVGAWAASPGVLPIGTNASCVVDGVAASAAVVRMQRDAYATAAAASSPASVGDVSTGRR